MTITGVNEGVEYVYDEKALKEIGWIWTVEVWDDVTEPGNLLRSEKPGGRIGKRYHKHGTFHCG